MRKIISYLITLLSISTVFAQVPNAETGSNRMSPIKIENEQTNRVYLSNADKQYLDGITAQWSKRLNQKLLYNDYSSNYSDVIETVDPLVLKNRLAKINSTTPLDIQYNDVVQAYVQKYLKTGHWMGKVMGLAEYYFPLFEDKLAKYNIPLEIKYLAIVESTLNPKAGSNKGALGLWQFIYSTGKIYDLEINSYVDERMDPLKSTEAACKYFERHYAIYGDWDLVLAAYNSGAGNVNKAIKRSGGYKNYWNIRRFLPRETQGYIPSFIAMTYLFEYAEEHNLKPNRLDISFYETDTVLVKNKLSFSQVSKYTGVPFEKIEFLNPQYKNDYIPRVSGKQYALRLPQKSIGKFVSQENYIYSMTSQNERAKEQPFDKGSKEEGNKTTNQGKGAFTLEEVKRIHKVKEGETMAVIANQYGVGISDIIKWNSLSGAQVSVGQELNITTKIKKYKAVPISSKNTSKKVIKPVVKKKVVAKPKGKKQYYTVKRGGSLAKIASKFGVSQANIKSWNILRSSNLYAGQKLVIYSNKIVKEKVTHKVRKGESLGSLSNKYGVNISDIKNWNKLRSSTLKIGQSLVIYPGKKGVSKSVASSSKTNKKTHTVKSGESLGVIAKKYKVSVSDLKKWNKLKSNSLRVGQKLVLYGGSSTKSSSSKSKGNTYHTVKSGESLYTIAKKYPGVSADNIKSWNKLKSNNLKIGQKLLIRK